MRPNRATSVAEGSVELVERALTSRLSLIVFLAVGAGLRVWRYGANPSLTVDEASITLDLIKWPAAGLLAPLDYRQVAPVGWLALEKGALTIFGDREPALRLVSLLASLLALALFSAVAARFLHGPALSLALALFALGRPFISAAAQVKPYATDVAAALALLLLALGVLAPDASRLRVLWLGVVGAVMVWVSYPAIFVLTGIGVTCMVASLRPRWAPSRGLAPLVFALALWAASGGAAVAAARRSMTPATAAYMRRFWTHAFMPIPVWSRADALWPVARLADLFGAYGLWSPVAGLFLGLAVFGLAALWRAAPDVTWLLLAPLGVTFAASAARLYPFAPRTTLFLLPMLLLPVAAGAEYLGERLDARWSRWGSGVAIGACAGLAVYGLLQRPPSYAQESLRSILAAVQRAHQPGDAIYVYYGAGAPFRYYAARYGFHESDYTLGGCWRGDPRAYLRELDRFRGRPRLWVVASHASPLGEETLMLRYLDRIGVRILTYSASPAASGSRASVARADLYDVSGSSRLAEATADTYAIPPQLRLRAEPSWSCEMFQAPETTRADGSR